MMRCIIFGAGAWGTAWGLHMKRLGHTVVLVPRSQEEADVLLKHVENVDYLPGFSLKGIEVAYDQPIEGDLVFLACPSRGLRETCDVIKEQLTQTPRMAISLCKGPDTDTNARASDFLKKYFPQTPWGVLSGPSQAAEVAAGKPVALVLASAADEAITQEIGKCLSGPAVSIQCSRDVIGVELGGGLKNVYAIGAGICDGLQWGDNARATYLTYAFQEMVRVGVLLGGQEHTFYGLSGFGDFVLTTNGRWSRNRSFGEKIVKEGDVKRILSESTKAVEGYPTVRYFQNICHPLKATFTILQGIYSILYEKKPPQAVMQTLLGKQA